MRYTAIYIIRLSRF